MRGRGPAESRPDERSAQQRRGRAQPPLQPLHSPELGFEGGAVARLDAAALRDRQPTIKHSAPACGWRQGRDAVGNETRFTALHLAHK